MNIVVCVKYVPDATANRQFESDNTVDRVGVDGLLSELDEYAVEQALQIKEKSENPDDVTVTAVCVGPEQAVDAVRKALQMGADQGVHVTDEAIAGSDAIATSLVLAKALEKGSYDLVMCGMASTDGTTATEFVGGTMPLVLSVTDQSGEARYPSFKGIMAAKKKPLETLSLSDLGIDAGDVGLSVAWSQVEDTTARPPREAGEIVKDEDGTGAKALADSLAAKKFI